MSSATSKGKLRTANTILSAVGSVAAAAMVARSLSQDFFPDELRDYFLSSLRSVLNRFSSETTMVVEEFNGLENNQIYEAAETYLGTKLSASNRRLKVGKPESENSIQVTADGGEPITDTFNGIRIKWILVCRRVEVPDFYNPRDVVSTMRSELRHFELTFHNKHRDKMVGDYLPWMLDQAKMMRAHMKRIKIYTLDRNQGWDGINLNHPATFDTLAMDDELKSTIEGDLKRFVGRKEYYRRVGKAWKRGYLLFGPPGTGKSSFIAAVANYLNFDIYDLDLTEIHSNSELRRLLVTTANRSILVVEDIDCSVELRNREAEADRGDDDSTRDPEHRPGTKRRDPDKQITLSGVLNFIDGLWSSCGDERIIILTTNHKERLDPALLRPGRMDMHIHMSYLTPCGFRILARNYLGILEDDGGDHRHLFEEIEELIRGVHVTPAEAAEQLMKEDNADSVLRGLVEFLRSKSEAERER